MTLYLIAHKVRGERAFDIAIKMPMPDGDWWIIPTSGHRAYPYYHEPLDLPKDGYAAEVIANMPADLPDHYPSLESADRNKAAVRKYITPTLEDL